jgi:regulatory protein
MNIGEIEEFDKLKTQVLKYVLYKKRSEAEVREKFSKNTGNMLDNVIEYLKENEYIDDTVYIEKAVNEFMRLKNMSIKEVQYKLLSKGISKDNIDNYIYNNREELLEYELNSAKQIMIKKENILEKDKIIDYLRKKGYMQETIKIISLEDN